MEHLDLFVDESGGFTEAAEGAGAAQRFPSQLVGLFAPHGELTEETALDVLEKAHAAAGFQVREEVHGNELARGASFDELISALLDECSARRLQPVRLVNEEAVNWGDRSTTYTAMMAEFVVRIVERRAAEGAKTQSIELVAAVVLLGTDRNEKPIFLEQDQYERRLFEQRAFACIRRGAPRMSGQPAITVRLRSGRRRRELQICDLLSNASHAGFKKCGPAVRAKFQQALGAYDQSLILRTIADRADEYLREGSFGIALRLLLEAREELELLSPTGSDLRQRLTKALDGIAQLDAPWRNVQLQALTGWLEQLIEQSRQLKLGYEVARWLLERVDAPLRKRLARDPAPLDWFTFALQRLSLTASNHRGALKDARAASDVLDGLVPRIAGRWEHATMLMQGFVAQAVHFTDCADPERAATVMTLVARYYEDLAAILCDVMPNVFPTRVRSELRGQALGTWLQAETHVALRDPTRIVVARRISDAAIDEFEAESDRQRQYQYRAHLETVAGDFKAAREFLSRALGIADPSHDAIARAIGELPEPRRGFPLLHWFRLGAACCVSGEAERDSFLAAFKSSRQIEGSWARGDHADYPAHGIRRQLAVILASQGRDDDAFVVLDRLRAISPLDDAKNVFVRVVAAAQAEVAAQCIVRDPARAAHLLDDAKRIGVAQLVDRVSHVDTLRSAVVGWASAIQEAKDGRTTALLALARCVPY